MSKTRSQTARRMPASVVIVVVISILGLGYIAGTFHNQIVAAVAPIFGVKVYTGNLDLSTVQKTYQTLKANYDGQLDDGALIEGANRGLVEAVGDDYTVFMNQQEAEDFSNDLSGSIGGGIGVELASRNETVTIVRLLKDNPAETSGIEVGDIVLAVNDENVSGSTTSEVASKIRGEVGTTVKVTVLRNGETKDFTITRAEVNNPSVYSRVVDGVGVMTVTRFDNETGKLAEAAAKSFKDQGVDSVILDLRGNGGGYVTAAQDLSGVWLDNKVVVREKTGNEIVDELTSGRDPILKDMPTVVLVNASSASASEIVAGALQDYKAAKLVGVQTFGKGSVQKLLQLPGGAELKVTIARWYTPNGVNISEKGITPDKIVEMSAEDIAASRDPQMVAARALLKD